MGLNTKEIARDLYALGSIPIFALIALRIIIARDWSAVIQMAAALALFIPLAYGFRADQRSGRLVIAAFALTIFFDRALYIWLAIGVVTLAVYAAAFVLHRNKVIRSAGLALLCCAIVWIGRAQLTAFL